MENIEMLKELFDEKIIDIIKLFLERPEKQFYLTEIATLSGVSVTTTFRILQKLVKFGLIKDTIIGKFRIYKLEKGEKAKFFSEFLRKEYDPIQIFVDKIKVYPRISLIILKEKNQDSAKFLLVGDFLVSERIEKICNEIKKSHNFTISFLVLSQKQFDSMREMQLYDNNYKVLWERKENEKNKSNQ
jgi:predicted transcriptional regulator